MISEVQRSMKDFELLVFTAPGNESCRLLAEEILDQWNPEFGVLIHPDARLMNAPSLAKPVIDYPTSVFSSKKEECGRYRGFKEGDRFDYLSGHGDLIAGAIIGGADDMLSVRSVGLKHMTGAVLSPFDSFLLLRGIKTLELRMVRHCESALALARQIESHPVVESVYYPGLESHPQYSLACQQMSAFGGMIALELSGGYEAGVRFMDAVQLAQRAVSLGDAETLVQHPASMTHNNYTEEEREAHDISLGLVRISVGLENIEDLSADILQALDQATG